MLTAIYHIMINFVNKLFKNLGSKSLGRYNHFISEVNDSTYLFNYDQIDKVITLIIENGYKIDYELTKIMIKNKSDKDLIFYITEN